MNINLKQLDELLRLLAKRNVGEFEFEDKQVKIRLTRGDFARVAGPTALAPVLPITQAHSLPGEGRSASSGDGGLAAARSSDDGVVFVTSPFVGTFYRSPSPDAPPFVEVGSVIREGQALCIVEAMKLMNEIESDLDGKILDVLVKNGAHVEYGQPLFRIEKS